MITVYRIIKFEFVDEETMHHQLLDSIEPGIYELSCGSRMTVRDRRDDPCERSFFSEIPNPRVKKSLITRRQFLQLNADQKDQLYHGTRIQR